MVLHNVRKRCLADSTPVLGMVVPAASKIRRRSLRMSCSGWSMDSILCGVGRSFMAASNSCSHIVYWIKGSERVSNRSVCRHDSSTVSSSSAFGAVWWKLGIMMLASRRSSSMSSSLHSGCEILACHFLGKISLFVFSYGLSIRLWNLSCTQI